MLDLKNRGWTQLQIDILNQHMDSLSEIEYEYQDNIRYARKDNIEEVKEYEKLQSKGSYDVELECVDGVILFGFNYGY